MKQQLIFALAAGLAGGSLGAVVVGSVLSAPESEQADTVAIALLEERLDDLVRQNERLSEQVTRLEDRPMMNAPVRADVVPEAPPSLEEERVVAMMEELQNSKGKSPTLPENFKLQVGSVLEEIRSQEEEEREKQREEARLERREKQLQQLAEKLGMDTYQTNSMRVALANQDAQLQKAREEIRDTGNWTSMRDAMTSTREETLRAISLFLTPTQVTQYEETNSDMGFRGGRGGRGGGGGGPGGGGRGGRGGGG